MPGLTATMRALLSTRRYAVLATTNADASIHMTPVWFMFEGERFFIASPSSTLKAKNAVARPEVSLMVDARKIAAESWVSVTGTAEMIRGRESEEINNVIRKKYLTTTTLEHPKLGPGFAAMDDLTIRITPKKWRSFDMGLIDQKFFGGKLSASPEKWFLPLEP